MRRARILACFTLAIALTGCSLQTAGGITGPVTLSAVFDDVQSLVVGHSVQISDVRTGTVTGIRLDGYHARVTMSLRNRLPAGTTATIAKTTLLGENYVQLNLPEGQALDRGPFLPDRAVITQTSVAPDLEQITQNVGPLLAALSGQDLSTIIDTSVTALDGKGRSLNHLIDQISEVSDSYAAASDDLGRALDALAVLGRTLRGGSAQLGALPGNVLLATQRLQADRKELKQGVRQLLRLGRSFNAKIQQRHGARLATLLARADRMLAAAVRGRDQLKTLALTVLKFLKAPSVSVDGQGLLFVWLKGFLPPKPGQNARVPALDLAKLTGPRP